jgi:hypothetical protein
LSSCLGKYGPAGKHERAPLNISIEEPIDGCFEDGISGQIL